MKPNHFSVVATFFVSAATGPAHSALSQTANGAPNAVLPDRYLHCVLSRATNIDKSKWQKSSEVVTEGQHRFALRLPPIAVRVGEAPDPNDPPEPVDARTQIVADPDGLTKGVSPTFIRVADLWPDRVELLSTIPSSPWAHLIIVSPIDAVRGHAHLFMTRVKDAATMDLQRIYQGECRIDPKFRPARDL